MACTIVVERLSCALQFQLIQSTSPLNSRYVVGIDLGTTNCALAVRDASAPGDTAPIEVLQIAQLVNPGELSPRPLLPSFLYVPGGMDFP